VTSVAFRRSGTLLLASSDSSGQIRLWDLDRLGDKDFKPAPVAVWTAHKEEITSLAFSPDGTWLASAGVGREIKLWDPSRQAPLRLLQGGHRGAIKSLAFSHDGKLLASGGGQGARAGEVFVWDIESGEPRSTFTGLNDTCLSVALSPQGHLAAGCNDGLIRLWIKPRPNLPFAGEPLRFRGDAQGVNAIAYSADGKRLASAGHDGHIRIWNGTGGQVALTLPSEEGASAVAFSNGGRLVAAAVGHSGNPGEVRIWDRDDPSRIWRTFKHPDAVLAIAMDSHGKLLVTTCEDKQVRLFDLTGSGEPLMLGDELGRGAFRTQVRALAISPDGRRLATASEDDKIRLWDISTCALQAVLEGHTDYVLGLVFSPDGRHLVSGSVDKTVRLWNLEASPARGIVLGQHDSWVLTVAYSADGRLVASGGLDKRVRLWNITTRTSARILDGSAGGVLSVAFHPDGRRLVSAGEDKVVRLWDLTTGQEVLDLEGSIGKVNMVAFSGDGRWLAAAGQHPAVRLWQAPR
jgi:WD40 repeat protein